ncbi:MAG: hypothetical protein JW751_28825 [Polyangiaceae bacterium]|nr:hypothetical protein [Polyangiaceae bacterium]
MAMLRLLEDASPDQAAHVRPLRQAEAAELPPFGLRQQNADQADSRLVRAAGHLGFLLVFAG